MTPPRRILVSRIRQIGDVILTLPVVDVLHERFPDAAIDYLAEEGPAEAVRHHPGIGRVWTYRRSRWPGLPGPPGLLARLRGARYDWAIDLYGNPRSALLLAWTGAPVRLGPSRRGRRRLYTHVAPPVAEPVSAIEHHLLALRAVGIHAEGGRPRLHLTPEERRRGTEILDRAAPSGGPRVGLHVGNRWPAKRWFEERFTALVPALSRLGARSVALAGPGERALAGRIARGAGIPEIPALPLREYWGVVAALDVLVTNDGSPLHAGPALGVPTVGILGPTVPEIWFPYGAAEGHQLLCREIWCRPCHRHECARLDCLKWIGVADAARAVARALAWKGADRASA
ncbi:MAG TPA: glycosyltransferase family 9 protein [Candidatus Eisenbacteria bacterium]